MKDINIDKVRITQNCECPIERIGKYTYNLVRSIVMKIHSFKCAKRFTFDRKLPLVLFLFNFCNFLGLDYIRWFGGSELVVKIFNSQSYQT